MDSRFVFTLKERNGILYLLGISILVVSAYYFYSNFIKTEVSYEESELRALLAKKENSENQFSKDFQSNKINPNYLKDYSGYLLGFSINEIDALITYRKSGAYITSLEQLQEVTGITDAKLSKIAHRFTFPQLRNRGKKSVFYPRNKKKLIKKDINKVEIDELLPVYGVGNVLAERIIKYRDFLGGFVEISQLDDVYGLKPEVVQRITEKFEIRSKPEVKTKNINLISLYDLAKIPYISFNMAKQIITYRTTVGSISEIKELTKLQHFPADRINIIEVYLTTK